MSLPNGLLVLATLIQFGLQGCRLRSNPYTITAPQPECMVFISASWHYESKELLYGATTSKQVQMLIDSLPCTKYQGYWEGPNWTGMMTICNHQLSTYIPRQMISWENDSFLSRNLTLFKRHYTRQGKTQLLHWCDSLDKKQFPYYVKQAVQPDSMFQKIQIHYHFPYKNSTIKKFDKAVRLTQDSINAMVQLYLPQVQLSTQWITSAYRDNTVMYEVSVSTDTLIDFAPCLANLRKKLPGITDCKTDSLEPSIYTLIYFVPQKKS
ncbi:MAG: hypothetical protein K1X81_03780 [Bacteroidia bacterium]|nr:hypothetical protein [Bacteroidia bacterium]